MSDLKKLLAEATPGPWHVGLVQQHTLFPAGDVDQAEAIVSAPHYSMSKVATDEVSGPNLALIVHLRNHAEDYEAAVDALDRLTLFCDWINDERQSEGSREDFDVWLSEKQDAYDALEEALPEARGALRRLRGNR